MNTQFFRSDTRWLGLVVLSITLSLAVMACAQPVAPPPQPAATEAPAGPTQPPVYKIGFINHLTGDAAVYGQSMRKGTELAVEEINAAGGVNGVPLEVIYEDDRLSAADAQTAFMKLVQSDKVPVVMGSGSSTVSLSICPRAQEEKVVQISSISTAPALKDCGSYFFSVMASDDAQGLEWARIAEDWGVSEAAVMYINNDYGIGVKDVFVPALEEQGGEVLISQGYEVGSTDFRTEVLKVKEKNPEHVFIVGHVKEGSLIFKQAKELDFTPQWIADVALQTQEVIDLAGPEAAQGLLALRAGSTETPEYQKFATAFRETYDQEPTIWSDYAYDTTKLVALAIEKGEYTADGIREALFEAAEDYVGPSGPKAFNEYGISKGVYQLMVVEGDQWVKYEE